MAQLNGGASSRLAAIILYSPFMKRRFWKLALFIAVPLVLFAITAERNSWRPKTILPSDKSWNNRLQFSPDGRYLNLTRFEMPLEMPARYSIVFYEFRSGRSFEIEALKGILEFWFISNNRIASGNRLYSFPEGKLIAQVPGATGILGQLPDGKTILTFKDAKRETITTWDIQSRQASPLRFSLPHKSTKNTGREICLLADKQTLAINDQEVNEEGDTLYEKPRDKRWGLKFWDIRKQKTIFSIPVMPLGHSRDSAVNGTYAFMIVGGVVEVWNYRTGRRKLRIIYPDGYIGYHALSPDGTLLAAASTNNLSNIDLWDIDAGKIIRTLHEPNLVTETLYFTPDGRTLASTSISGVKLWRIK